ncbi:MAG: hypothetical protein SFV22_09160, partial [Saprospiraceae bacterium]|nr:hypothetical protein [Saprospiraceae bacterium]
MQAEDFSKAIEQAYKTALEQADLITANAREIRKAAELELDAAKATRAAAEKEGEKMAQAYFEGRREHFAEAARTELLRNLTRTHLEAGKNSDEISEWLQVSNEFIENIYAVVQRVAKYRGENRERTPIQGNPKLIYSDKGRGGTIRFESEETRFEMWWEFAGSDALVIVDIPTLAQWHARTNLPLDRR